MHSVYMYSVYSVYCATYIGPYSSIVHTCYIHVVHWHARCSPPHSFSPSFHYQQEVVLLCLRDVVAGIATLHEHNFIHGDIKSANSMWGGRWGSTLFFKGGGGVGWSVIV